MFFQRLRHASTFRLGLLVLVLCGVLLTGSQTTGQASAAELQAAAGPQIESSVMVAPEMVVNAPTDAIRVVCPVNFVGMNVVDAGFGDVSIYSPGCPGAGVIEYRQFAGDGKKANQILAIALSAKASGRNVVIFYDSNDTSGLADPVLRRKISGIGVE